MFIAQCLLQVELINYFTTTQNIEADLTHLITWINFQLLLQYEFITQAAALHITTQWCAQERGG